MYFKVIRFLICLVIVVLAGVIIWLKFRPAEEKIEVSEGKINKVEEVVRLCSTEFYREVPVLDTINSKVLFGLQKQRGSISFDIDKLRIDESGDTIKVTLPPEIVEIYESTDRKSWEVIDTKAIGPLAFLKSDKLTIEEENLLKQHIRQKSRASLYADGTVARARAEGAVNLRVLLEKIYRKPVVVTD